VPWRGRLGAGPAPAAAERHPDIALNEIAGAVRSIAIDIVRASEASEIGAGGFTELPTEELLASLPFPEPLGA
jgi:hypothetical protein